MRNNAAAFPGGRAVPPSILVFRASEGEGESLAPISGEPRLSGYFDAAATAEALPSPVGVVVRMGVLRMDRIITYGRCPSLGEVRAAAMDILTRFATEASGYFVTILQQDDLGQQSRSLYLLAVCESLRDAVFAAMRATPDRNAAMTLRLAWWPATGRWPGASWRKEKPITAEAPSGQPASKR